MSNRLPRVIRRALDVFASFTPGQKAVTVLAVLAVVVGGALFASWAARPSYAPLFTNLATSDAAAITEKLTASGVPYKLADGGQTILVPQDQVYDLRLRMSAEGLPAEAESGYSLLDKQGITTSEFMQHVGYQRALEGELSKTIKAIDGVKAATVHLVIPQKDIFANDQSKPSASVLVVSEPGKSLNHGQVQAIVHLVASSVEGLEPERVTVAGSDGRVLSTGDGESLAADADLRAQQTAQFEQRMNAALQRMLDSVVGPGNSVVQTSADLDFDQTETKTQRYTADPDVPPLSQSTERETYTGTGPVTGGVLGPDNIQVPGGTGNGEYTSTKETRNNAVGMVTETRKSAPGNIRRLSVSVLINQNAAAGINNADVQQMVTTAAGLDLERGDAISVTTLPFDTTIADEASRAEEEAAAADRREQIISWAKTGAMVLIVLVLLLMAWRANRRARRTALSPEEMARIEQMQAELEQARLALTSADAPTQVLPGGENDAMSPEEQREMRRRELSEMVAEQPEDVANLLRAWIADRR
ncbi:MAG: flagellar M-ring protein FliF [Actinobacteria bacterium]|nr:MAG: flagellar M-ring protein FliF [Actinomycetota bacterium]